MLLRVILYLKNCGYSNNDAGKKILHFEQRFNEFYRTDEDIAKLYNLFAFNEYSNGTLLDLSYYKDNLNY